uniref:Uncharacterized protein n=1 Tax=Rhizophora mucronata TaxID=61149 RepID=A0A2P2IYX3_RHIMU
MPLSVTFCLLWNPLIRKSLLLMGLTVSDHRRVCIESC